MTWLRDNCPQCERQLVNSRFDTTFRMPDGDERLCFAVPAALYERTVRAGGLLYETDEGGESVQLHGRSVPIVELGEYVPDVIPSNGSSPFLVIAGAAEKRMGMSCEKPPVIVRTSDKPYRWRIDAAPLARVANVERKMPKAFISKDGFGITAAARRYLEPLIWGEDYPRYRQGLPSYVTLKKQLVEKKLPPFEV